MFIHGKLAAKHLLPNFSLSVDSAISLNPMGSSRVYGKATQAARRFFQTDARLAIACGYPGIDWKVELADLLNSMEVLPSKAKRVRLVQVQLTNQPHSPVAVLRLAENVTPAAFAKVLDTLARPGKHASAAIDPSRLREWTLDVDALQHLLQAEAPLAMQPLPAYDGRDDDWMVPSTRCNGLNLMGGLCLEHGQINIIPGILYSQPELLVLPAAQLLADSRLLMQLMECVESGRLEMQQLLSGSRQQRFCQVLPVSCTTRFLVIGERPEIAALQDSHSELGNPQLPYLLFDPLLTVSGNEALLSGYLLDKCRRQGVEQVDDSALKGLARELSRLAESQHQVLLDSLYLKELLRAVRPMLTEGAALSDTILNTYLQAREDELSSLSELTLDSILRDLLHIDTSGKVVGQVNGLSVVSVGGHPAEFGEPVRITAIAHYGDGDLADVERKAELGGNLHAKGMLLVQGFLQQQFGYHHPLPLSYSLAFEQSYQETDGDSASLAALCAILSAMVRQPLLQSLAVTGAVDHFGRVQAVGGINEKIEGFFALCQRRGLDGNHGVILPACNVQQLNLSRQVVDAVEQGLFTLYGVEDALEALTLLCQELNAEQIVTLIESTLRALSEEHGEESHHGLLRRIPRMFRLR